MAISYVPIKDDLSLVFQDIKRKTVVTQKQSVNHIWIYDRSGSMSGLISNLINQMVNLSKSLPKNDTISIGWFSSEGGEFDYIVKGFKITDSSDYKKLESIIRNNGTTIGCTCFSEILADSKKVIADLSAISKSFSFAFFTDGYPVVSNIKKETDAIFKAIEDIKGDISSAMVIGYGYYYNKELMANMAESLNAILISSNEIKEYEKHITNLVNLSQNTEPKEVVEPVVTNNEVIFSVTDSGIVINSISKDGKIYISPQSGKNSNVFYVTSEKPNKKSWDKIEVSTINFGDKDDILAKAMYAAGLVLTQKAKTDIAISIVGKVGDVNIIDKLTNAFTIDEYSAVESEISNCISDVSGRFLKGKDENYLPKDDAFCVFDVLNILMNDDEANFFPYHEKFNYEKITVGTKAKSDYPKFEADNRSKSPFDSLVWHESKLNLSVKTTIKGKIKLNTVNGITPASVGLADYYPTYIFRNYSFIKDGRSNIKVFYIDSSELTYKTFKNVGIIVDDSFSKDKMYGLNISKLPVINKKIASVNLSASDLSKKIFNELELCGKLKALKFYKKSVKVDTNGFSDEQKALLVGNGVNVDRGGDFSPPYEKEEAKDKYFAKSFEIKVAGYSSLPSVNAVKTKIDGKKNRTPAETLVEAGIVIYDKNKSHLLTEAMEASWLDTTISKLNGELKTLRNDIQKTKFAIILGKKWFNEFSSREDANLTLNDVKYKFVLSEDIVEI